MKRMLAAVVVVVVAFMGGMAVRAASGTPEIDRANATMQFQGNLKGTSCVGEDGISYTTYRGSYAGAANQVFPDNTDYVLGGPVTITGIQWTVNLTTKRGVLTGTVAISNPAGARQFSGKLTLITQGLPGPGVNVPGRGWIVAAAVPADEQVTPSDDSLLANVEFALNLAAAVGQYGDLAGGGTMNIPDFSVVTNVAPKAADGTC